MPTSKRAAKIPIIFLGTGASAPFDYPPTKPFVDALRARFPDATPLGNLFRSLLEVGIIDDVEHILEVADHFEEHRETRLRAFFSQMHLTFPKFKDCSYDELESLMLSLRNEIRTEIFRTYSWKPRIAPLLDLYDRLFSIFGSAVLDVFTTNYDRVIEEYCGQRGILCYDGFRHNERESVYEWDPSTLKRRMALSGETILWLHKLHGSLNWRRMTTGRVVRVNPEEPIGIGGEESYSENLLIYPAQKDVPESDPFRSLYDSFERRMSTSNLCVVLGFSFRDPYLNEVFADFLRREKTLLISLSPSASFDFDNLRPYLEPRHLSDMTWKGDNAVTLNAQFDPDGLKTMAEALAKARLR